jgi:hypothetical protein
MPAKTQRNAHISALNAHGLKSTHVQTNLFG